MSENYLNRDCNITLREALDKYYAHNPDFYQPHQLDNDSKKVFFAHDVCHIIFGCDTSLDGESKVDIWMLNAIDLKFKEYFDDYMAASTVREALDQIPLKQILLQSIISSISVVKVYFAGRRVQPKWSFYNYQDYLERSILDIRRDFNIQIV
jgi:ubiquinone biosynthesis protein Coq4